MASPASPTPPAEGPPKGDPWQAFSYLVTGVLFYGLVGWALDRWLETSFLVIIGIFVGAGLGIYMTFGRFGGLRGRKDEQQ
ncbi:AtpZ/AtpI family protein [Nocardioides euryhalodurans]|jgi:hypothetical protein|uniref:AtpZ/AtpI family protein n=1 Tax=Nocardioides euryhalodurans TaxID=2518370 RepID=A0A4P7GII6_9ACTN|nr:AtpZ/AtpI family protein [Nocardioides euryhalodurans]QBR91726.1 AtpZ/AtpI family protein [Nocardioides euryhalodurans]